MSRLESERKRKKMSSTPEKADFKDGGSQSSSASGSDSEHSGGEGIFSATEMQFLTTDQKLNLILEKVTSMDAKLSKKLQKVERKVEKAETDISELKKQVEHLKTTVEDHANRMRRNNVILHGVPEGAEVGDCIGFVHKFMSQHMDIDGADTWGIERAHRSPSGGAQEGRTRPIFVKFLRYQSRVELLKQAPKKLKNSTLKFRGHEARIYISDDVTTLVRQDRKKLTQLKKEIKSRFPTRKVFIPPTVPAILLRENAAGKLVRVALGTKLNTLD